MNNLTTRKIVLGMLMALVLTFSVQGIADALTFTQPRPGTKKAGDLQTVLPRAEFTISFALTPTGDTIITNASGKRVAENGATRIDGFGYAVADVGATEYRLSSAAQSISGYRAKIAGETGDNPSAQGRYVDTSRNVVDVDGRAVYTTDTLSPRAQADPDDPIAVDLRAHYNQEAITITTSSGTIEWIGNNRVAANSVTLNEDEKWSDGTTELTNSIRMRLQAPTVPGRYTITAVDATPAGDLPNTHVTSTFEPFIFYVWQTEALSRVETFTNTPSTPQIISDEEPKPITVTLSKGWARVEFQVYEGSGTLFEDKDGRNGPDNSPRRQLIAFSNNNGTEFQATVYLRANRGTSKVRAWVYGNSPGTTNKSMDVTYIYKWVTISSESDDNQFGARGGRLDDPLVVRVQDGGNRPLSGEIVKFSVTPSNAKFIPVPGTIVYVSSTNINVFVGESGDSGKPDSTDTREATSTSPRSPDPGGPIFLQTDSRGEVSVYLQLSPDGTANNDVLHTIMASTPEAGNIATLRATSVVDTRRASLVKVSGDNQRSDADTGVVEDSLIVRARSTAGYRIPNVIVKFEALSGTFRPSPGTSQPETSSTIPLPRGMLPTGTNISTSGNEIFVKTNADGEAGVDYNVGQIPGAKVVTAEVFDELGTTLEYVFVIYNVTFNINGRAAPPADDVADDTPAPAVAPSVPSTVTGPAGGTARLTVTAPVTATVTAGGLNDNFPLANAGSFTRSSTGTTYTSTLTLPNQVTSYSLSVFVNNTRYPVTVNVTAAAAQTGGTLTVRIDPFSGAPGSTATVTVTTADSSAQPASVTVNLTATGGTLSSSSVATGTTGTTTVTLTRGSTVGNENYVTVSGPSGYDSVRGRYIIAGPAPRDMTVGEAAELNVYDGNNQDGSLNSRLAEPFIVEVVDANDNPVEDARVRFRTTIGSGRFSPRAFSRTDEDGLAEITFTPTSTGRIRVVATVTGVDSTAAFIVQGGEPADALVKVSGDNQSGTPGNALANPFVVEVQDEDGEPLTGHSVTFSVTAGGGSLSETSVTADEDGLAETTLTLGSERGVNSVQASVSGVDPVIFSTNIEPKILVAAANRPVMYWIDSGMLYSLAGAKAAKIAESANGVAVSGGKIYWTSQINPSSGTINSANLDGTDAATLASIKSVPIGIAVDTAGSKLYWTNARGRIQSANLNGSSIQNVMQNLTAPTDIVVSNGFIYWTEGGNSVRRVNISGQKIAIDVAVNLDSVGGLAVGSGKVYWTEMTSATAGTVNGANLNGTNFETLATLRSAPMGISVDTAGSKLYWTNARGRVQSANLNGSMIKNVVEGLISPSKLAIGGSNTATTTTAKKATTPAKKDNAAYDVNGDGAVDNTDASLVAAAMNTSNTKYDVNGDGAVNFLDLLLVFDNREDAAAAAPTIVGMKLTAIQIDIIQEQIDLLIATNDRSPAALRTLVYMQQLLATARPEKTQLFANYPNPFNPETWIPYELATDTHVTITIYNTQGVVIRTLQFGHQSAGYYTDRDRAAYWDGRNALGEQVASGLYFYQLETDTMSSMRKMVILK